MSHPAAWTADDHILGDWGTSRLRLFRVRDGIVIDRAEGPGIGAVDGPPAQALLTALEPWRAAGAASRGLLCGMVGSRNGIVEVPYADCPTGLGGWRAQIRDVAVGPWTIGIAPGLACVRPEGVPDVMRGEETQIFGALALNPRMTAGRHVVALPGTHGKWALVEDGSIRWFQTFPTGELFALLRDRSTLTRAGGSDAGGEAGFEDGLARAEAGGLLGALFEARSAQLRADQTHGWAIGFLSGLAIGHEVREAMADALGEGRLTLVGDPVLSKLYERALARHGRTATVVDGAAAALAGLAVLAG